MSATVHDISNITLVPILAGAAEVLVAHRELRGTSISKKKKKLTKTKTVAYYEKRKEGYETNRSIKTWATYFLLKSQTTSGIIQNWTAQKKHLLQFCKATENSFRARLAELQQLKLITITKNRSILLTSFETAADILGIAYTGIIKISYNDKLPGQQIFQYFLRAEEMRSNQLKQLNALWYYAGKNPLLKEQLHVLLRDSGSDEKKLRTDMQYFQTQLLTLQQQAFKEGSPLLDLIHTLRADINRSVKCIRDTHTYKSAQSVCYMKKVMRQMEIITVTHVCVESTERSRLYISEAEGSSKPRRRDAYKYIKSKKQTAWFLTDQVNFRYKSQHAKTNQHDKKNAA